MSEYERNHKAAIKGIVFFSVTLVLLLAQRLAEIIHLSDYNKGRVIGGLTFECLAATGIVTFLAMRSTSTYSWLKFGFLFFLSLCSIRFFVVMGDRERDAKIEITGMEGTTPSIRDARACQAAIPFTFSFPTSDFAPREDLFEQGRNVRIWVWESSTTGERIMTQVLKGTGTSRKSFEQFALGIEDGGKAKGTVNDFRFDTDNEPLEAILSLALENGNHLDSRCLSSGNSRDPSWTVCLITVSNSSEALAGSRASLTLENC